VLVSSLAYRGDVSSFQHLLDAIERALWDQRLKVLKVRDDPERSLGGARTRLHALRSDGALVRRSRRLTVTLGAQRAHAAANRRSRPRIVSYRRAWNERFRESLAVQRQRRQLTAPSWDPAVTSSFHPPKAANTSPSSRSGTLK